MASGKSTAINRSYSSSIAPRIRSLSSISPRRSRSSTARRPSPIDSPTPFRYGASSTPRSSGEGSSPSLTIASVILASAYSFWASWRNPAK